MSREGEGEGEGGGAQVPASHAIGDAVLRELFDAQEDGVVVHDAEGLVVEANAGACRLLGYERADLIGRSFVELSGDAARASEHLERASTGESTRFDWRAKRRDGTLIWAEARLKLTRLGGVPRLLAELRDIEARKADEARLGQVEQRYEALARSIPKSCIIICDHDLRFVLVDGPEVAASGMSKAQMEGHTIFESLPADFARLVEGNMRRVLAGESFTAELPFGEVWYHYSYVPLCDADGAVLYGMILGLNITERRRAEEALRRSEERLAKIVTACPDLLLVTRVDGGELVEANPSIAALGWTRAEVIGKSVRDLHFADDAARSAALIAQLAQTGKVDSAPIDLRHRDGSVIEGLTTLRHIEVDEHACVLTIFRDVSEQTRTTRALEASEARLRSLSEATFEGIAITEAGRILDVNEQLAAMLGWSRRELVGRAVDTLVAPESRELVRARVQSPTLEPYEHAAIRADGSVFFVEVRPRVAEVQGRQVRVSAIRDVTEAKRAQAERDRLMGELQARNVEMEQFTYSVSHDLKSPLVTINGFLGMLERDLAAGDAERAASDMARIGAATKKLMGLLNDLLELSRVGRVGGVRGDVQLGDVVRDALERVSGPLAARGVEVQVGDALPVVRGDQTRLVQVVQNLVENAIKYMGPEVRPAIAIAARTEDGSVILRVEDNGIGVDPRYAERIFALFEKLDPRSEGTGIGLALVRRIVEFHGGRVWVESDGSKGSTFVVSLPAAEGSPPVSQGEPTR